MNSKADINVRVPIWIHKFAFFSETDVSRDAPVTFATVARGLPRLRARFRA